jgi:hypothetical protein
VNISDALVRYGTALPVAPTVLPDVSQSHGGLQPCLSSSIAASISLSTASAAETCSSMGTLAGHRNQNARPLFSPGARFSDDNFLAGAGPGSSRDPETHR